jgi:hypothetical protein
LGFQLAYSGISQLAKKDVSTIPRKKMPAYAGSF